MSAKGKRAHGPQDRVVAGSIAIVVEIPARNADPFLFRREFLRRIRLAINLAQIDGEINAAIAVECLKALPPAPDLYAA
jgi:hypothetical protein